MITDLKLQEEVKMKVDNIARTDPEFQVLEKAVQKLFEKIEFDENKEWDIKFSLKVDPSSGIRNLTGTIKMTDKYVTGEQLQIFAEYKQISESKSFVSNMQSIVNESDDINSISISGSGIPETVIASKTKFK